MSDQPELSLNGRQRRRLRLARENGFLDATCRDPQAMVQAYGLWCWRLRIPMVWFERQSSYSRYGLLHLEMMTTPHSLSAAGQADIHALSPALISPQQAGWRKIPRAALSGIARTAFRAAIRPGNYQPDAPQINKVEVRPVRALARIA